MSNLNILYRKNYVHYIIPLSGRNTVHNSLIPHYVLSLFMLLFQSTNKRTKKALSRKVPTTWISLQHSPVQGYVVEGRLRVIQSSLALATNEEGALVKVGKVAILEWAWLMWAQQHAAVLTSSPRWLSPQRQAGRGSELTSGSSWQNA